MKRDFQKISNTRFFIYIEVIQSRKLWNVVEKSISNLQFLRKFGIEKNNFEENPNIFS